MMTTPEVARTLGVSVKTVRRIVKETGLWWELKKSIGYEFNDDQVDQIARVLSTRKRLDLTFITDVGSGVL